MSAPESMPSVRRRPIPGMTSQPVRAAAPSPPPTSALGVQAPEEFVDRQPVEELDTARVDPPDEHATDEHPGRSVGPPEEPSASGRRWPAADYAATRLANFRVPVDLHDRYRDLVRDAERRHPRLRRASLTEVLIALLEEGPRTPDEVAELISRKRAAEHGRQA